MSTEHDENNRAEQSHEAARVRERGMRKFKSIGQAQRFVTAHAAVSNLFNLGRHLVRAEHLAEGYVLPRFPCNLPLRGAPL